MIASMNGGGRTTCNTKNCLPSHVGKLKYPALHASHLSLIILALQLQTPLSLQVIPFDPSPLQLQAVI